MWPKVTLLSGGHCIKISMRNPTWPTTFYIGIFLHCSISLPSPQKDRESEKDSHLIDRDVIQSNFEKSGNFFLIQNEFFLLLFCSFCNFLRFSPLVEIKENQTKVVKAQHLFLLLICKITILSNWLHNPKFVGNARSV